MIEIIITILPIVGIGTLIAIILSTIIMLFISRLSTKKPRCSFCKGKISEALPEKLLYIIPVTFDNTYEASATYYIKNMKSIDAISQIPSGGRACYLQGNVCEKCSKGTVTITDFLYIRDIKVIQGIYTYDYDLFKDFLKQKSL